MTGSETGSGEARRKQARGKNIAVALALIAFVVLFYLVTIVRMGSA